ncbi:MAG: hypothetical protein ACYTGD_00960 [Planctomycetota bacterium]|jgi:hypothetical protein
MQLQKRLVLTWILGAVLAPAVAQAEPEHCYYYFKEPQPLGLRIDQVAVHHGDADAPRILAELGLSAVADHPWRVPGWTIAEAPGSVRTGEDLEQVVSGLAADGAAEMVSPTCSCGSTRTSRRRWPRRSSPRPGPA